MIEDLTTRIVVFVIASGLLSCGAYETFFNHKTTFVTDGISKENES